MRPIERKRGRYYPSRDFPLSKLHSRSPKPRFSPLTVRLSTRLPISLSARRIAPAPCSNPVSRQSNPHPKPNEPLPSVSSLSLSRLLLDARKPDTQIRSTPALLPLRQHSSSPFTSCSVKKPFYRFVLGSLVSCFLMRGQNQAKLYFLSLHFLNSSVALCTICSSEREKKSSLMQHT